jgi:hypothetical protein
MYGTGVVKLAVYAVSRDPRHSLSYVPPSILSTDPHYQAQPCITQEGFMTRAKKSFRLELTKEQQALVLQKTGVEAKELELSDDALRITTERQQVGDQR